MRARGFTLIELIVAITISAIVMVFAAMFIGAPLGAYETHSRRAALVADTSGAWPRMETDMRAALPGSLRARRNGNVVVIEMLPVLGVARYKTSPSAVSFTTAGTYTGVTPDYLSVNPDANVYAVSGSMAAASNFSAAAGAIAGEQVINVNPAPAFGPDSPKRSIYYVSRPVTYLCDEGTGTLRRYANYSIAANQLARDTAAELNAAGAASALVTQGLTACNFQASTASSTQSQTAAVRLTTTRNGDVVTLLHSSHAEYVP
jgi:MSHA biogenesis protein MshO